MHVNNYIQIAVILIHSVIIFKRHAEKIDITIKDLYGSIVHLILLFLLIYELNISDLSYKKWYWFMFDFLLAFYFALRLKENKKLNNFKNKKIHWL
jgi:Ca2+/Na+ antiporter